MDDCGMLHPNDGGTAALYTLPSQESVFFFFSRGLLRNKMRAHRPIFTPSIPGLTGRERACEKILLECLQPVRYPARNNGGNEKPM